MAKRQLCLHVGCVNYRCQGSKYCEKHREADEAQDRKRHQEYLNRRFNFQNKTITSDRAKFYQSTEYKRKRKLFLEQNRCAYCTEPATEVHHDYEVGYDYYNTTDFLDVSHWVPLCSYHHRQISNERKKDLKRLKK